ncbi:MAG: hypothetical protein EPO26_01205 [Chloroflexota bacterium]|nr:MAG: hypothetical protein EPO26_01205 [Chloroflexota bacterium]
MVLPDRGRDPERADHHADAVCNADPDRDWNADALRDSNGDRDRDRKQDTFTDRVCHDDCDTKVADRDARITDTHTDDRADEHRDTRALTDAAPDIDAIARRQAIALR